MLRRWISAVSILFLAACGQVSLSGGANNPGEGAAQAPGTAAGGLLVDDFEDGDGNSALGGGWYTYDDKGNGGGSEVTVARAGSSLRMVGDGHDSEKSLLVEYTFERGTLPYEPFIGFGVSLGSGHSNLSSFGALEYTYKGGEHEVRIETANVKEYDYHAVQLPESPGWKTVKLAFDLFRQGGWGPKVPFAIETSRNISWHVRGKTGKSGRLQIDNVRLLPAGSLERGEPNLVIHEPAPPKPEQLESVETTHPLQRVAMASLNQGYNITNFLEAERFSSYGDYDEAFVKKLAAAGYESLRLPIDLDTYVEKRVTKGGEVKVELHPDLFRVLDDYDKWTKAHGLSLTIDYHQYDHSFDVEDPASAGEMVALWGEVAKHFAKNPRQDLFYELLNEPELAAESRGPTAAEWTAVSQKMIAAIRQHDRTRPILFGDVKWYDIDRLVERTPFGDPNVIYVFHFYDPFIFTHQGAPWVSMGSAHDVPYPYSKERWSDRMEDLGFTDLNPQWQLDQVRNYHRNGNREALRNRLVKVKRWAVEKNVPIICNEFGVHMSSARKEDIARYYTDLIGLFEELEIPWQVWFMLMDAKTGEVDPAYRKALRLE
jgi:endoglucanase